METHSSVQKLCHVPSSNTTVWPYGWSDQPHVFPSTEKKWELTWLVEQLVRWPVLYAWFMMCPVGLLVRV
jgi:hypothetical protein